MKNVALEHKKDTSLQCDSETRGRVLPCLASAGDGHARWQSFHHSVDIHENTTCDDFGDQ